MAEPIHHATHWQITAQTTLPDVVIAALEASAFGPFEIQLIEAREALMRQLSAGASDALILVDDGSGDALALAGELSPDTALLVVVSKLRPASVLDWLQRGAQDVLLRADLVAPSMALRLRAAIERHRLARDARMAYATDLDTGLPHQQQLIEHMSQLIALREREPAPMAVLVLRVEGLATTEARLGREASNVLRRKVGVRLRAGVRASDVVASLGDDHFAVLLGSMLTPADAERVGAKLQSALMEPFKVSGVEVPVATAIGVGQYPQDGSQPDALLRRAIGLAAAEPAQGRAGFSNFSEIGAAAPAAANDE